MSISKRHKKTSSRSGLPGLDSVSTLIFDKTKGPLVKKRDIERIHEKTLWVLENVGVEFNHPLVLEIFRKNGFRMDGNRVYMTRRDFENHLGSQPDKFEIGGLESSVVIGEKPVYSGPSGALRKLRDRNGENLTVRDYINVQRINDTSLATDMANTNMFEVEDLGAEENARVKTALTLWTTGKPIVGFGSNKKEARDSIRLARDFHGKEEGLYIFGMMNVLSPLTYDREGLDVIMEYVRHDQSICITSCSMPGLTSPVTLAGTLVQNNAEIMAGVILTQVMKPGTPVMYGNTSFASDMRYAGPAIGGIESSSFIPYIKGLADYYGMPCRAGGAFTDSKEVDWQSGVESSISLYTSAINGVDFIYHSCGELDAMNMFSYEKFLLDEQVILMMKRLYDSYDLNDDFCLESIKNTGPGGHYLYENETTMLFRKELMIPDYFQRDMFDTWVNKGKPEIVKTVSDDVQRRIDSYCSHDLSRDQKSLLMPIIGGYIEEKKIG